STRANSSSAGWAFSPQLPRAKAALRRTRLSLSCSSPRSSSPAFCQTAAGKREAISPRANAAASRTSGRGLPSAAFSPVSVSSERSPSLPSANAALRWVFGWLLARSFNQAVRVLPRKVNSAAAAGTATKIAIRNRRSLRMGCVQSVRGRTSRRTRSGDLGPLRFVGLVGFAGLGSLGSLPRFSLHALQSLRRHFLDVSVDFFVLAI